MRKEKLMLLQSFLFIFLLNSCNNRADHSENSLFKLLPPEATGVSFINTITTDDSINILNYEYLYNGGGIGIGDFNNDGKPDMFFSGNMVPCRLYINKGNFEFEDITGRSGIDTRGTWAFGVSVVDINNDGFQDIYLCAGGIGNKDIFPNKLFINRGDLTFEESAEKYGLADAGESIQATFFDYDRDGDLDMYLLTGGGFERSAITPRPILRDGRGRNTDRLYRNDFNDSTGHPHFTDVSAKAGIQIEGFGLGVSVVDINEDEWPDIYVTNDYLSKDHLYINNRDGTFSDQVDRYLKHTSHFAMGNDAGDINNDGYIDIVAVDMLPEDNYRRKLMFGPNQHDKFFFSVAQGYGYQYMRNTLQLNNGNGSYSEIGQLAGIDKTDWSWAPLIADFDSDGFQDIIISNGFGKDVTDLDFVKFRESIAGLSTDKRRAALLKSLKDRPEIKLPNYAYKNNRDNTFSKVTDAWGFETPSMSNGMAYADFDSDGDLDLVINNINQEAFIYQNTAQQKNKGENNFLRIRLKGNKQNNNGFGATITVIHQNTRQVRYQNPVRGFQSTVENILHFGLGAQQNVDTIRVAWSDGSTSTVTNPIINQVITIFQDGIISKKAKQKVYSPLLGIANAFTFKHSENDFNDYAYQRLLPHKLSQEGPGIAIGDVNNDGFEDIFIGGSYRLPANLLIQNSKGNFSVKEFSEDMECEDMGALFFDADNDGDQDLYVVSGGVEFYEGHERYQDRLYINDGKGNFKIDTGALPQMFDSGSCVIGGDYDSDGDTDLFVGGRVTANQYPRSGRSYVLRNDNGKFEDVTNEVAPGLAHIGMVTAALWTDIDNDNALDLIVSGEAMPISVFRNATAQFMDISSGSGLENSHGFWNSLVSGDFDNDGDTDYIAGNSGLNGHMKASVKEPLTIHYADYDRNGDVEPIIGYFENGISYPFAPLDILTSQIPSLKKNILYHRAYAESSIDALLALTGNPDYETLYCKILESCFVRNDGKGKFNLIPLPQHAQVAPLYGMMAEDINGDGNLDLLGAGNSYSPETVYGRYDAMIGVTFLGDGAGGLNHLSAEKSGFFVNGDAKGMARIETTKGSMIAVTQNNDSLKSFLITNSLIRPKVNVAKNEVYAMLFLKGARKRRLELHYGSTYLSQSSRSIMISDAVDSIKVFNHLGKLSRTIITNKSTSQLTRKSL